MMIFWIIWITWCVSEIFLNRFMRSGADDKKDQDKGSIWFIWMMIVLAISSAILLDIYTRFPVGNGWLIPCIGLGTIIAGMILRFVSILTLGRLFTVDVTIRANHIIKKNGVYRVIRHPSYAGSLLSFIGFGLSLNNWFGLITVTILITIALIHRINMEEKLLIEQFGSDYLDYKKNTCRLIPWIY